MKDFSELCILTKEELSLRRDLSRGLSAKVTDYSINTYTDHLEQSSKLRTALNVFYSV